MRSLSLKQSGLSIYPQEIAPPAEDLPFLSAVRSALNLPLPSVLTQLSPALDAEVFRSRSGKSPFGIPHFEVLEWIGDRELNSVAASVVVVLAPTGLVEEKLTWHQKQYVELLESFS